MKRIRLISLAVTLMVALGLILWMNLDKMSFNLASLRQPPRPTAGLLAGEEEFVDLFTPGPAVPSSQDASPAYDEVVENNSATPAPETGMDLTNQGASGMAEQPKTSTQLSPLKKETPRPEGKKGPSKEEMARQKEQEEARRKASADMKSAFQNTSGKNNTQNGGRTDGNAGRPDGKSAEQNGHGTGTVGGGWKMPSYAKVPSSVTGTIKLKAIVNRSGKVVSVEVIGGDAPAATTTSLVEACKAEIRSKTFTRSDSNAPETATAYITYNFR